MSADAQPRAELLFYEALELAPGEREIFLSEACGGDATLRGEVDELLRAHDGAAGFLQVDAPASPGLEAEFARLKPEEAGERIGNYKLLEQIGEGGFGVVWVAEQEKPVRRRVALKSRYAEAEPLLLEGNEALQQSQKADSINKRDALARLVCLYEAWDKTDKAADWQQKLADFDKAEAKTEAEEKDTPTEP